MKHTISNAPKANPFILVGFVVVIGLVGIGATGFTLYTQAHQKVTNENMVTSTPSTAPTAEPTLTNPLPTTDRPPAPLGYSWQECSAMKASFLKPDGWFFREENKGDTTACFITKEEIIGEKGEFQTGLSVNAIKNVPQKTGLLPSVYAKKFSSGDPGGTVLRRNKLTELAVSSIKGYRQFMEVQYPGYSEPVNLSLTALGNDATGVMYVITFETPPADWGKSQEIIQAMGTFGLDDEF